MKGIFVAILAADYAFGLGEKCMKKDSIEDFKSCIQLNTKDCIQGINLKSYKQKFRLSKNSRYEVIFPEDGSDPSKKELNATIFLEPGFVYLMCFFDKDFLIYVSNSLIVPRSCLKINQNTWSTGVEIKVHSTRI